ncbi:endonuclease/exonuclease/phosphatase family protein, partial [Prevotella scopos]|uniref:endonuclease/exonuclease/phosphatase family protein n=1 Tax=Prevotella scopos TaxID=589437 RepID=UPI004032A949
ENLRSWVIDCRINDAPFLLEEDTKYGGVKPRRNYNGMRFNNGFSDHLPLVLRLQH